MDCGGMGKKQKYYVLKAISFFIVILFISLIISLILIIKEKNKIKTDIYLAKADFDMYFTFYTWNTTLHGEDKIKAMNEQEVNIYNTLDQMYKLHEKDIFILLLLFLNIILILISIIVYISVKRIINKNLKL
jgi:hypothetical protein